MHEVLLLPRIYTLKICASTATPYHIRGPSNIIQTFSSDEDVKQNRRRARRAQREIMKTIANKNMKVKG